MLKKVFLVQIRNLKRVVGLFTLFLTSYSGAQDFNLKDLVEYGVKNSPKMQSSKLKIQSSQLSKKNALSNFFPSLDIKAIHGYQNGEPETVDNPQAGQLYLTLSETLYNNGSHFTGYDIASLNEKKAHVEFARDRGEFCLSVVKEYYAYSQSYELLKVQEFQYKILLQQFKSIESKYKRGEKTRTEYLRFKAQLQRSNLSLKQAQNTLAKSTEELKSLIGFNEPILNLKAEPASKSQFDKISIADLNLKTHYEAQIAQFEKQVNDKNVSLVKRAYYPEISLTAGVNYSNTDYLASSTALEDNGQTDWSALLTLKYNLWDWGIKRRNVSLAEIEKSSLDNAISQRLLQLKAQLARLVLDLKQLKDNYLLNKELVDLERNNYQSIVSEYRNGRATFLDLVDSVDNLTDAQNLYLRNYYELSSSLAEYKFHQGKLYESIVNQ